MIDQPERRRRDEGDRLQRELDQLGDRAGATSREVQAEVDRLTKPGQERQQLNDRRTERREGREKVEARLDRAADSRRVRHEVDQLLHAPDHAGEDRPGARLERDERISERGSMRHLADFDLERTRDLEDLEIRTNPEGFLRRNEGGLDRETRERVRDALKRRGDS